ncbi:MAG: glycerol 3-phosphatase-2 [Alphaproteobacteria bacterium]
MKLTLDEIINVYENSRSWYGCTKAHNTAPKMVQGLKDSLEGIDLVLLDSYGVLCRGAEVIPQALDAIAYLRAHNIPFCIVSNDTMNGQHSVEAKYKTLGYDFTKQEVITSLDVVTNHLQGLDDLSHFAATGLESNLLKDKFPEIQDLNIAGGKIREGVNTLMFHVGKGWTMEMQEALIKSAANIKNIIIGNPDAGAPDGDDFVVTPGFYASDFYRKTGFRTKPTLLGKPAAIVFEQALKHINYKGKPENVLMVGDSLHTDILGGQLMGFKTLLLESGIFRKGGLQDNINKTGIIPTYIAPNL